MIKKTMFALLLMTGLAFVASNVSAQCAPGDVLIMNNGPCTKTVTVDYGDQATCTVMGTTASVTVAPGGFACIPIPPQWFPLRTTVTDVATSNSSTVEDPACGPNQMGMHMACGAMCNIVQWVHPYQVDIHPD